MTKFHLEIFLNVVFFSMIHVCHSLCFWVVFFLFFFSSCCNVTGSVPLFHPRQISRFVLTPQRRPQNSFLSSSPPRGAPTNPPPQSSRLSHGYFYINLPPSVHVFLLPFCVPIVLQNHPERRRLRRCRPSLTETPRDRDRANLHAAACLQRERENDFFFFLV